MAYDNLSASTVSVAVNITIYPSGTLVNVAAQSNGGVASASSVNIQYAPLSFLAKGANDGDRYRNWANDGGWADNTANAFPDWLQVSFAGTYSISEIDVFTIQDNYNAATGPTATMTFSQYGITAFDVQYWTGGAWVTVPGGSVTGNNLVWRRFTFPAVTTDRIRVLVNGALASFSRILEVEAYSL